MGTVKVQDVEELQGLANATLREAMTNERCKRWHKVIHNYRVLVRILNRKNLPANVVVPPWHSMLMYEIFYHLGIALQHIQEHRKAVSQYTKAIEAVFISKNGCLAGCNANSCLMTPLYARRSYAYAKTGDNKSAMKDAEKAVVLDNKNPDVYCVRALVKSTKHDNQGALADAKTALKYNSNHLCALILKGRLVEPLVYDEWLDLGKKSENVDHKKACSLNPDCHNYLDVQDFNHNHSQAFYERFLYSLSVPHTISELTFTFRRTQASSRVSSAKSVDSTLTQSRLSTHRGAPSSSTSSDTAPPVHGSRLSTHRGAPAASTTSDTVPPLYRPFRCGTPAASQKMSPGAQQAVQRRRQYSDAVRDHVTRPKTADECIAYLEKQRLKKTIMDQRGHVTRKNGSYDTLSTTSHLKPPLATEITTASFVSQQPTRKVFQEVNIKDAPRMYYRPWLGDRLPVAEVERKEWITPPFKV